VGCLTADILIDGVVKFFKPMYQISVVELRDLNVTNVAVAELEEDYAR
jgi:hypothetical protein